MGKLDESWNTMMARKQIEKESRHCFANLNVIYNGAKREQSVKLAAFYIKKVSENLLARFEAEKRRIFNEKLNNTV